MPPPQDAKSRHLPCLAYEAELLVPVLIIEKNLTVSTKMPRKYGISTLKYPKKFPARVAV